MSAHKSHLSIFSVYTNFYSSLSAEHVTFTDKAVCCVCRIVNALLLCHRNFVFCSHLES